MVLFVTETEKIKRMTFYYILDSCVLLRHYLII